MKVGILTHYDVLNQGAQLQMYAMYHQLLDMGHTPVILSYQKNFDFEMEEKLKNHITIKSVPYILVNYLWKKGIGLTWHNVKKYIVSYRFRKKEFEMQSYDKEKLDAIIIGSDEVFSIPVGINKVMFGYNLPTDRIIAYAPSFGQTDMERIRKYNCEEIMRTGLKKFTYLSARDEHTKNLISELSGQKAERVCDPAILYDFSNIHNKFKKPRYKYMVVYSYDRHMNEPEYVEIIKKIAREKELVVISPGTYHKWCDKNVVCDALQWLEWIRNAEFVITDTFHGTIASFIMQTPMAVFVRNKINVNKLQDLVKSLKIENRVLAKFSYNNLQYLMEQEMEFKQLFEETDKIRKKGCEYLESALRS